MTSATQDRAVATQSSARTIAWLAGGVLCILTVMDVLIVLWPDVGRTYVANSHLLLALGFAAATLVVVSLLSSAATGPGREHGSDRGRASDHALASIPGYSVYKDARGDSGRSNYVLVGQGGVYVVHVDDRAGTVRVDRRGVRRGRRMLKGAAVAGVLRQSRDLEERIRRHAGRPLPVTPVHVFTNADMARPARSGGVWFARVDTLAALFDSFRQRLHPADVAIVQALLGPDDYPRSEFETGLFERPRRHGSAGNDGGGRHNSAGF